MGILVEGIREASNPILINKIFPQDLTINNLTLIKSDIFFTGSHDLFRGKKRKIALKLKLTSLNDMISDTNFVGIGLIHRKVKVSVRRVGVEPTTLSLKGIYSTS